MTNFKENVIKLTDYPFIFSIVGSLFVMIFDKKLYSFNTPFNELVPVLIFIGIIGTIISIIDPLGRFIKKIIIFNQSSLEGRYKSFILDGKVIDWITNNYKFRKSVPSISPNDNSDQAYMKLEERFSRLVDRYVGMNIKRALNTNWITYEIDKVVSTFYFIIILFFLTVIVANPDSYKVYVEFVGLNLNSTNTNESSKNVNLNSASSAKDSEKSTNNLALYSELRIPVLIIFVASSIGIFYIFLKYCFLLRRKLWVVAMYFGLIKMIEAYLDSDSGRGEFADLTKIFTDSLNVYDWELAAFLLERIKEVIVHIERPKEKKM